MYRMCIDCVSIVYCASVVKCVTVCNWHLYPIYGLVWGCPVIRESMLYRACINTHPVMYPLARVSIEYQLCIDVCIHHRQKTTVVRRCSLVSTAEDDARINNASAVHQAWINAYPSMYPPIHASIMYHLCIKQRIRCVIHSIHFGYVVGWGVETYPVDRRVSQMHQ